jgi:hypothetical protein
LFPNAHFSLASVPVFLYTFSRIPIL